jgi:hypothetical protein
MKGNALFCGLCAGAGLLLGGTLICRTEDMAPGQASGFSAVEYYPNSQQIRVRTSGDQGTQVGDQYLVTQFKLEWFAPDGHLVWVATAPECLIDQINEVASSSTHLILQSGDAKMRVEGDGFLWQQKESSLTISNKLVQVTDSALTKPGTPKSDAAKKSKP